jgi:hypothetical protein
MADARSLARLLETGGDPYADPAMEDVRQTAARGHGLLPLKPLPHLPPPEARSNTLGGSRYPPAINPQDEFAVNVGRGAGLNPLEAGTALWEQGRNAYHDWQMGNKERALGEFALPQFLGIFAGVKAKTANLPMLERAKAMEKDGFTRDTIWQQTGWGRGRDSQWRFEIPDDKAVFNEINRGPTADYLTHPGGMFKAYREVHGLGRDLGDIELLRSGLPDTGAYIRGDGVPPTEMILVGRESRDPRSIALHEYQHAIQQREGFAKGSNHTMFKADPDTIQKVITGMEDRLPEQSHFAENLATAAQLEVPGFKGTTLSELRQHILAQQLLGRLPVDMSGIAKKLSDAIAHNSYRKTAGEVEARNVQKRMDMTAEERKATPPWETQDVPDAQQILRFGGAGIALPTLAGALRDLEDN